MNINRFSILRPYLYHLTYSENAENIIDTKVIYSTRKIVEMSALDANHSISNLKRSKKEIIDINGIRYSIRDQKPLSEKLLNGCLTNNWTPTQFYSFLNQRAFMWCTIDRLQRHFDRYIDEKPVIFRFNTHDLISLNGHVKFTNINSGATRANSHLGGVAPSRGQNTFLTANEYNLSASSVAEVTFEDQCNLPEIFEYGYSPNGPWKQI